jgi:hypothetical protein
MEGTKGMSRRRLLIVASLFIASSPLWAAFRLYLTDGGYQLVNQYEVKPDRVRFLSADRGEWEEIPSELVDLKKTEAERQARTDSLKQEAALIKAEDEAVFPKSPESTWCMATSSMRSCGRRLPSSHRRAAGS